MSLEGIRASINGRENLICLLRALSPKDDRFRNRDRGKQMHATNTYTAASLRWVRPWLNCGYWDQAVRDAAARCLRLRASSWHKMLHSASNRGVWAPACRARRRGSKNRLFSSSGRPFSKSSRVEAL